MLLKTAIGINQVTYNNQNALMSACANTDGFVCICSGNVSNLTSTCNNFVYPLPNIARLNFTNSNDTAQYSN